MIDRIVVKNFKTFVNATVDLGLVNVFIGANGSGKSNLLEAVAILSATAHGEIDAESASYRGVRNAGCRSSISRIGATANGPIGFTVSMGGLDYQIELGCSAESNDWVFHKEDLVDHGREVFRSDEVSAWISRPGPDTKKRHIRRSKGNRSIAWLVCGAYPLTDFNGNNFVFTALFDVLRQYSIFTPATLILRRIHEDSTRSPLGRNGEGLARAIFEMIDKERESLGPFSLDEVYDLIEWSDDLSSEVSESALRIGSESNRSFLLRDRFMRNGFQSISPNAVSEGALYVLFLLALVGHPKSPRFFGIDNFDQALHPRLARELTRMIADQIIADGNRQMLATTHNPLVLDGLNLLDDRIRLFAVDRDDEGASQIRRIEVTEELMAQSDNGMSLSRLWIMGRLGGMPKSL